MKTSPQPTPPLFPSPLPLITVLPLLILFKGIIMTFNHKDIDITNAYLFQKCTWGEWEMENSRMYIWKRYPFYALRPMMPDIIHSSITSANINQSAKKFTPKTRVEPREELTTIHVEIFSYRCVTMHLLGYRGIFKQTYYWKDQLVTA